MPFYTDVNLTFPMDRLPARLVFNFEGHIPRNVWQTRLKYDGKFFCLAYNIEYIQKKFEELEKKNVSITNKDEIIRLFKQKRAEIIKTAISNDEILKESLKESKPLQHQFSAIRRLFCHTAYITADDMGLGKTYEAIAAMNLLSNRKLLEKGVIIACPNSIKYWWKNVVEEESDLKVIVLEKGWKHRKHTWTKFFKYPKNVVLVTNYELAIQSDKNNGGKDREFIKDKHISVLILDEAQRIKNSRTQTHKSLKQLKSNFTWLLTGTPIENHPGELFNLISFMADGVFSGVTEFQKKFADMEVNYFATRAAGRTIKQVSRYKNLSELAQLVKPMIVRRLKEDVLDDLPEISHSFASFELGKQERIQYDAITNDIAMGNTTLFANTVRLQVICSGVKTEHSEKIRYLMELINTYPDKRFIIFSKYKKAIHKIMSKIDEEVSEVTGSIKGQDRLDEVEKYMSGKARIIAMTNAGALGLNLQKTDIVVNYDLPWNPATWNQRIDRAHRIGTKNPILSINFIASNTIEEQIYKTFVKKKKVFTKVIDRSDNDIDLEASFFKQIEKSILEGLT